MRCVNLIERNELQTCSEKFRVLLAEANIQSGCIQQAITILEQKLEEQEILSLEIQSEGATSENELGGPSSGFAIGSSSN